MTTWLLLDCHYLCHRAYHTTGHLGHAGTLTGVTYGFLRDLVALQQLHGTQHVVFCFDGKDPNVRETIYPPYKERRRDANLAPDVLAHKQLLRTQIKALRTDYLPGLGYRNIFCQDGYESDDLIARICTTQEKTEKFIIVSTDKDLYQLLAPNVRMFNPAGAKTTSHISFTEEWGVTPDRWPDIKAIAGCSTDDIKGIPGVGEKTAVKYLRFALKTTTQAHKKIVSEQGARVWARNLKIVKLPFAGTMVPVLQQDNVTQAKWRSVAERLGFKSAAGLYQAPPAGVRQSFGLADGKETQKPRSQGFGV